MRKLSYAAATMLAPLLWLVLAIPANGDEDAVRAYTGQHGAEVCALISDQPDLAGVKHAVDHILATSGMPEDQTGRLLGGSVATFCPEDADLVEAFVWYVRRHQQSGGIGAVAGS